MAQEQTFQLGTHYPCSWAVSVFTGREHGPC